MLMTELTATPLDDWTSQNDRQLLVQLLITAEVQRFVEETQDLARALRSRYRVELQRETDSGEKLTAITATLFGQKPAALRLQRPQPF